MDLEVVGYAHFVLAIQEIERNGVPKGFQSSTYDVLFGGKRYPPKLVFSRAYKHSTGTELSHKDFEGGTDTPAFKVMQSQGIEIVSKEHAQKSQRRVWLIAAGAGGKYWDEWKKKGEMSMGFSRYPVDLGQFDSHEDVSRWLNSQVEGRPSNTALAMWEFGHGMQIGDFVLVKSGKHDWLGFGEVASDYWHDDSLNQHKHRRKAVWVKSGNWKRPASRRPHPMKSLTEITHYENDELGGAAWLRHVETMYGGPMPRYWLFHGNARQYNFKSALEGGRLNWYAARQHRDLIQEGDKALLWITGRGGGLSAVMDISGASESLDSGIDDWKDPGNRTEHMVPVRVTSEFYGNPISQDRAIKEPLLASLFLVDQGTNFEISPGQFHLFMSLAGIINKKMKGPKPVELKAALEKFLAQIPTGNLRFAHYPKRMGGAELQVSFGKGNQARVPWFALTKPGMDIQRGIYPILLYYRNLQTLMLCFCISEEGDAGMSWPVEWVKDLTKVSEAYPAADRYGTSFLVDDFSVKWTEGVATILDRNGEPVDLDVIAQALWELTQRYLDLDWVPESVSVVQEPALEYEVEKAMAKNTILYGPPGTGKTWTFLHEYADQYTAKESAVERKEVLERVAEDMKWWQAASLAILEHGEMTVDDLIEHEMVKAKLAGSNSKNVRATLWGSLQEHVSPDCPWVNVQSRRPPYILWKAKRQNASVFSISQDADLEEVKALDVWKERIENLMTADVKEVTRYEMVTFHQSFSYEDFVEGIKPVMEEGLEGLSYQIEDGVFKRICQRARNNPDDRYAIFIDEINRGNVASIFGELITLIEPNKRLGEEDEVTVLLPYSKTEFGVPANLDIYGTMNTADRSVEALDTALRRRFTFEEVGPNPELMANKTINGINLTKLLETINSRVEHLLDRDHCIGHSYFYNLKDAGELVDLQTVFARNILPLLQEYFYGDLGKIGLVLGKAFVEAKSKEEVKFADFEHEDRDLLEDKEVFRLADPMNLPAEAFRAIYG
ncbi:EVE domain-containing protein [Flavobacteriales bacterium]|nr:EVE domain-containing protein [Flavobacteriales bacterium]